MVSETKSENNASDIQQLNPNHRRKSSVRSAATRVQLEWRDVKYQITTKDGELDILRGVSGYANPGELIALMGSSGAGKTSLLNILSNRLATTKDAVISGRITANGYAIQELPYTTFSAYVTQEDVLIGTLTPRECISFVAFMKIGAKGELLNEKVDQLLEELSLKNVADNLIGSVLAKGLSGGQIKRVCIAIETITDPSIIFLDEPTSGLDSFTAEAVIRLMQQQAMSGRTILCTIHQPSYSVFKLFDRLILLSNGNTVYQGPVKGVIEYFDKIGFTCPERVNPADYLIDLMHIPNRKAMSDEEKEKFKMIEEHYERNQEFVWAGKMEGIQLKPAAIRTGSASCFEKYLALQKRFFTDLFRNRFYIFSRLAQTIFSTLLIIAIYNNIGDDDKSISARNGVLNFVTINCTMIAFMSVTNIYHLEKVVFIKEQYSQLYGPTTYYFCKLFTEFPITVVLGAFQSVVIYFVVGLNTDSADKWFIFFVMVILMYQTGFAVGLVCSIMGNSRDSAQALGNTFAMPLMIFNGFFVNFESLPPGVEYIKYLSVSFIQPFKYGFTVLCLNEYTDLDLDCEKDCDPLGMLGIEDEELWENFLGMICILVLFCLIAILALHVTVSKLK